MNFLKPIALLLGGLWLFNKLSTLSIVSTLNAYISGFRFGGFSSGTLDLAIQNPRSAGFVVHSIVGDLYLGDEAIANVSLFQDINVAATSQTVIPLTLRVGLLGVLSSLKGALEGNVNLNTPIRFVANLNVNGDLLPVDITYNR